jgi:tetratricopeptide (TPR) repeat protein
MTEGTRPPSRRWLWWVALVLTVGLAAALFVRGWSRPGRDALRAELEAGLKSGQFDRAAAALGQLERLGSPTIDDVMLRARVAMARGRTEEALAALAQVPDDHPRAAEARLRQGQLELRRDRVRAAEHALREALRLFPRLVQARRELVYIYGMQLRRAELGEQFLALAELGPLTFRDAFVWTISMGFPWDPAETVKMLERFVKADSGDRWSRLALAEAMRELGRLDQAEEVLRPLGEADPDARAALAQVALDKGAVTVAETLLADGPIDHPGLAVLRGQMALLRHDGAAALEHLRIALKAAPEDRNTQFYLGKALQVTGDREAARPLLEAADRQDALSNLVARAGTKTGQTDPRLAMRIGAACEAAHRLPQAVAWYKLAFTHDPLDPEVRRALARLEAATRDSTRPPRRTANE